MVRKIPRPLGHLGTRSQIISPRLKIQDARYNYVDLML
jgi:hypothetical protein